MAPIPGGVRFTGFVAPSDDSDTYAVIDPFYGIDGWRSVADTTARDAIPTDRRREGMVVVTQDTGTAYQLKGGITNSDWSEGTGKTASYSTQTGVISGCELSAHPTNNQAVIIAAGVIQFLDSYTDKDNPVLTEISYPGDPELVITGIATTPVTSLAINISSVVVQQEDLFTNDQKRTLAVVGQVNHIDQVQVRAVGFLGRQAVWQTGQTISDLIENNGVTNKDGNDYSAASTDLTIKRTEGSIFAQGAGTDKNSNTLPTIEDNPILVFLYFYLNASLDPVFSFKITPNNLADPDNYVKNGVLTAVPTGLWSVQRISMAVGPGSTSIITYGREVYDSLRTALLSIEGEEFIPSPNAENVVRRYFMAIKQGTTDLSDISQAFFTPVDNPEIPQYIDNINRGIIKFPTITKTGGLGVSWVSGSIYDETSQDVVLTVANSGSCVNNAVNYLYWVSTDELTLSTTAPVEPNVSISRFNVQDGTIYFELDEDLLRIQESNLLSGVANVFPSIVINGLEVSEDTDPTDPFDVVMSTGTFYSDLHKRVDISEILSRTTPLVRHFHNSGVWDSDLDAEIDKDYYDNGTNVTVLSANRYAKGMFLVCEQKLHWIYPREQFTVEIDAINSDLPEIPPGLVGLPLLTAYVQKQGDTAFASESSGRWIDIRTTGGAGGVASAPIEPPQDNAVWWSSVGSTTNDGRSLASAKSTANEAIAVAVSLLPTSINPINVRCEDSYFYGSFNISATPWVNIDASKANIRGIAIILGDNTVTSIGSIGPLSSGIDSIVIMQNAGEAVLYADKIYDDLGTGNVLIEAAVGKLISNVGILECFSTSIHAINVSGGQIHHAGNSITGTINVITGRIANVSITGKLDGDIICANASTVNVSVGGEWVGDLTANSGALVSVSVAGEWDGSLTSTGGVVNITCGSRKTPGTDTIDSASTVIINGTGINRYRTIIPPAGSAVTYTLTQSDAGSLCLDNNETVSDTLTYTLPTISSSLAGVWYEFSRTKANSRYIINTSGGNFIKSISNIPNATTTETITKGAKLKLITDGNAWYVVSSHMKWKNLAPLLETVNKSSSATVDYTFMGALVMNTSSNSAIVYTFADATNLEIPTGAYGYIRRTYGTLAATMRLVVSGSQVFVSREASPYIANPTHTLNYYGGVKWEKIAANTWLITGDVSSTAN